MAGDSRNWRIVKNAEDLPAGIDAMIAETVEWFLDDSRLNTEDFIDRLCQSFGGDGYGENDWDITELDSPAVRKIMREARSVHREATS